MKHGIDIRGAVCLIYACIFSLCFSETRRKNTCLAWQINNCLCLSLPIYLSPLSLPLPLLEQHTSMNIKTTQMGEKHEVSSC
jgi:hypothetical protein